MTFNIVNEGIVKENCTIEHRNTIINLTGFSKIPVKKKPKTTVIRGHKVKGFTCFNFTENRNRTWSAKTNQRQYYTTPSCNATMKLHQPHCTKHTREAHIGAQDPPAVQQWEIGNQTSDTGNGTYWIWRDNTHKWLPKGWFGSCFQAMPPLKVLWQQPQGRPRARRTFSIQEVQDNLQ